MIHLSWNEVRDRSRKFSKDHAADWSEAAHKQTFWNDFFKVFGLRRSSVAAFEENVVNVKGNTGKIDLLWKGRLIVEQKSKGQSLDDARDQAFNYIQNLTSEDRADEIPRYVVCCDFAHFVLYDLEPEEQLGLPLFENRPYVRHAFTLADFEANVRHFAFLLGQTRVRYKPEDPANEKAYARMCQLHDDLTAGGFTGHALERLLVRVLFCLFAEDNGIFEPESFSFFVRHRTRADGSDLGQQLNYLFEILDTPPAERPAALDEELAAFPYVNGKLFEEKLRTPVCNKAMRDSLLFCGDFQWERVSPAVFGSLFQGILEDRARRQQGAHYTSERDIMKVVHSLFLDDLRADWARIRADKSSRRRAAAEAFLDRLRGLRFLDPACGCGNFLVLAYRELRALEIDVLKDLSAVLGGQTLLPVVNVHQFYGIELGEWPARIAEVALWLMDHQMNRLAAEQFSLPFDRLPLTAAPHILVGNSLRMDWETVLPRAECSFILGNPPFVGKKEQNAAQKADMKLVWGNIKGAGVLDYVTAWYLKAARYISGTQIPVAFVSTNSITQGEQVPVFWREIFLRFGHVIRFAHRTFSWQSEARGKAHVHVVIIGFGKDAANSPQIYEYESVKSEPVAIQAANINAYLLDGPSVVVDKRMHPLSPVPEMDFGSKAADFGHLILSPAESTELSMAYPFSRSWIRPFLGSEEFINHIHRFCLWLKEANPSDLRRCPPVLARMERVRADRLKSVDANTRRWADFPALFQADRQPDSDYLVVPKVSSERRRYVPLGFVSPDYITNPSILVVPGATLYHFGVLSGLMHMAWFAQVGGRLESRFQYSNTIVYNNFPWPTPSDVQRTRVEKCAQAVLDARAPHLPPRGMSTLADLYDPRSMPAALAKAHADLDRAVERCYRPEPFRSDRERVEHLFRLYETLTAPLLPATPSPGNRRRQTGGAPAPTRPRRGRTPGLPGQP